LLRKSSLYTQKYVISSQFYMSPGYRLINVIYLRYDYTTRRVSSEFASIDAMSPYNRPFPSALDAQQGVLRRLRGRRVAVFLDYDGALAPIAPRPELAVMSEAMRPAVRRLAAQFTLRHPDEVQDFLQRLTAQLAAEVD
jgi:hypothetical protein